MQLDEYVPSAGLSGSILKKEEFAVFLTLAVKSAALKGIGSGLQITPLSAFRYSDGQQMLTSTSIISDATLRERIVSDPVFQAWPFRSAAWEDVHEISLPDLSVKERHLIDGLLTEALSIEDIHNQLPFKFDSNEGKSLALLSEYIQHYRRYPSFARVQS